MTDVTVAVIPAAGMGTRMLPATRVLPKELLPVAGIPLINRVVAEAYEAGIREFVFVVPDEASLVLKQFAPVPELERYLVDRQKPELQALISPGLPPDCLSHCVVQSQPGGLGEAVLLSEPVVGGRPFAVLLADVLMDSAGVSDLALQMSRYRHTGAMQLLLERIAGEDIARYGSVKFAGSPPSDGEVSAVSALAEKLPLGQAPSDCAVIGRYILDASIFPALSGLAPGHGGEIQLTDALNCVAGQRRIEGALLQGRTFDAGNLAGWLQANLYFAHKENASDPSIQALACHGLPKGLTDAR